MLTVLRVLPTLQASTWLRFWGETCICRTISGDGKHVFYFESQRSMAGISGQDNDDSSATTLQNGSPKSQSVTATVNGNGKRKSTE